MVLKKSTSAAFNMFGSFGRDKASQQTAWRMALRSQTPRVSAAEAEKRIANAKLRLKDEPVGSAIRLDAGVFLKKKGNGSYEISSLQ